MAERFASSGDWLQVTAATAINDFDPFTFWAWVYPDGTPAALTRLMAKTTGTALTKVVFNNDTSGNIRVDVDRATVDTNYVTTGGYLVNATWSFVAVTYDSSAGAGEVVNIYHAAWGSDLAECSYATATDGSGATVADSSHNLRIMGERTTGGQGFAGRLGPCAYMPVVLTLQQLKAIMYRPRMTNHAYGYLGFPGEHGSSTAVDQSGNAGTVSVVGFASSVPGPPLPWPWGGGDQVLPMMVPSAGGLSIPVAQYHRRRRMSA